MPRRLLLEGAAIEPLLRQARAEHGQSARIVKAEKVRVGGVGGFFAKERYEVTVEVDDESGAGTAAPAQGAPAPGAAPAAAASPAPRGIAALLAAAEEAERGSSSAAAPHEGVPV